ncbi:HINT domain-containing protein [Leptospira bandrabouensis]|uniref:polymorphic toxin-type HINT domain-containing protein n=1 Tax=Leptospira bandrabouensis TaxID=2484903 RepID=UPI001EE8D1D9|nr:polymorphic toxin-type HINT domain-containing protein [Leptospira bandrabouensis]MCG6146466.1 HINT domain-containing protein [Leptospira bandrabouensis]MCG6161613.1 HINT domain-containing protein [Leptospira bandrabouensis]MCG6166053.1 HINT domain-containing protein [Leptospira bandrabouensis]MCW7459797.1 HINT domain-containing protein [Leptospira bandrabouensis]MCW7479292.1 HINT domain-containing protein [Leptospira bandrabouensis]
MRDTELVLSKSDETGEVSYRKVVNTFIRQTEAIYTVSFADGTVLETTWNHPFRVKTQGHVLEKFSIETTDWVEAKDLHPGDVALGADGKELAITDITIDEREETVYNFEVEGYHTYFVGEVGVWVHNADKKEYSMPRSDAGIKGLKKATDIYLKFSNGEISKSELESELKLIKEGKYIADPTTKDSKGTLKFDASKQTQGLIDRGTFTSQWFSADSVFIDPGKDSNFILEDTFTSHTKTHLGIVETENKKHYNGNDKDYKLDYNFPGNNVPGPNKDFNVLYVGPGNKAADKKNNLPKAASDLASMNQGNVVIIKYKGDNEDIYASIGHNKYINVNVKNAAASGKTLPANTYIGTSGAIGELEVRDGTPRVHTHFTLSTNRKKAIKAYNGN